MGYVGRDEDAGALRSHVLGAAGEHLGYTCGVEGDLLTIGFGGTDSRASLRGALERRRPVDDGAWQWPGGGSASTMTRAG